jgi:hypothetical protein
MSERVQEASYCARYCLAKLTQTQAFHLSSSVSTFEFFISGDTTMKDAIKRLRQLRRAVHELDEEPTTLSVEGARIP